MKIVLMTEHTPEPQEVTAGCLNICVIQTPHAEATPPAWVYAFCYVIVEVFFFFAAPALYCGKRASLVVVYGLSCPVAWGIFVP